MPLSSSTGGKAQCEHPATAARGENGQRTRRSTLFMELLKGSSSTSEFDVRNHRRQVESLLLVGLQR